MTGELKGWWRRGDAFFLLLVSASIIALYYPVLWEMVGDWKNNDNYSHGFFIPIISAYMIWALRPQLRNIPTRSSLCGLLVLFLGLAQLYVATVGTEFFLQRTSLIIVLFGVSLFLFGNRVTQKLLVPIAYLMFMVPLPAIIWNKIAFPMQLFSSAVTEEVVRVFGIPIFREGNVLHLAQTTLEVVDACSGLRSLLTMFALSTALAWFGHTKRWKQTTLFLLAAPVAVFANIVRLTLTAAMAAKYGGKVAQGFLHDFSGLFTFVFGLILLILCSKLLSIRRTTRYG